MTRPSETQARRQRGQRQLFAQELAQRGFTPEQIAAIFDALSASRTEAKAKTLARVRKHRQKKPASPPQPEPVQDFKPPVITPPAAIEISPEPTFGSPVTGKTPRRARKVAVQTPLPPDWTCDAAAIEYGAKLGLSEKDVKLDAMKFRNYYHSKGEQRADWPASFRNWLIKTAERRATNDKGKSIGAAAGDFANAGDFAIKPRPVL